MKSENNFYIYVYLDNRKSGSWSFENYIFTHQPFYIGKGKHHRINNHLQPKHLSNNSIKSNTINSIIRETSEKPIHYKLVTGLSFEEANELECKMIKHFGRIDIGTGILTNMTDGGEGFKNVVFSTETKKKMSDAKKGKTIGSKSPTSKIVIQEDLNGNFIKKWDCAMDIHRELGINFRTISNCCRGITKSTNGYKWRYDGTAYEPPPIKPIVPSRRKPVYQYTLDGDFIQSYESASYAEQLFNTQHIGDCCLDKHQQICGYRWFYEFKGNKLNSKVEPIKKPVYQYSLNGTFIAKHESARYVLKTLKISRVGECCKGGCKQTGGYMWFYEFKGNKIEPHVITKHNNRSED